MSYLRTPAGSWIITAALAAGVMASFGPAPEAQVLTGLFAGTLMYFAARSLVLTAARGLHPKRARRR